MFKQIVAEVLINSSSIDDLFCRKKYFRALIARIVCYRGDKNNKVYQSEDNELRFSLIKIMIDIDYITETMNYSCSAKWVVG